MAMARELEKSILIKQKHSKWLGCDGTNKASLMGSFEPAISAAASGTRARNSEVFN